MNYNNSEGVDTVESFVIFYYWYNIFILLGILIDRTLKSKLLGKSRYRLFLLIDINLL